MDSLILLFSGKIISRTLTVYLLTVILKIINLEQYGITCEFS
jgi:hypothetical protein